MFPLSHLLEDTCWEQRRKKGKKREYWRIVIWPFHEDITEDAHFPTLVSIIFMYVCKEKGSYHTLLDGWSKCDYQKSSRHWFIFLLRIHNFSIKIGRFRWVWMHIIFSKLKVNRNLLLQITLCCFTINTKDHQRFNSIFMVKII